MMADNPYVAKYQTEGGLDSVMDYPLYYKMIEVFTKRLPMQILQD